MLEKSNLAQVCQYIENFHFEKFASCFPQVSQSIQILEKIQNYKYKNSKISAVALIHRSCFVCWPQDKSGIFSNENFEFLGDSFLNFYTAFQFMKRFPDKNEGELSRMRASLVSTSHLAVKARGLGLAECLLVGKSEKMSATETKDNVLADAFEAVTAALLLDAGEARCTQWLDGVFTQEFDDENFLATHVDAKSKVQQWSQSFLGTPPVYEVVGVEGSPHDQYFIVAGIIGGLEVARNRAKSKREASKLVAKDILKRIEKQTLTQDMILKNRRKKEEND